jgi:hypothetical protein
MSSKIDHESGVVTITAPCYSTMPIGHRLHVCIGFSGCWIAPRHERDFERNSADYEARLLLSHPDGGRAWGEGIAVKPPAGALEEAIANGSLHPSLVAEPNGNGNGLSAPAAARASGAAKPRARRGLPSAPCQPAPSAVEPR